MAKILLVEDDNNLREIYEARLQAEGYTIVSAVDGEEALVVAKKEKPDLVISDVMMPRISGFEMLDILRNTEGLKNVKVIMLTALGQAEDKTRADSLGADRYLVKSQVTLEDIVKAAHELLGPEENSAPGAPQALAAAVEQAALLAQRNNAQAAAAPSVAPAPAPAAPVPAPAIPVTTAPPIASTSVTAAPAAAPAEPAVTPAAPAAPTPPTADTPTEEPPAGTPTPATPPEPPTVTPPTPTPSPMPPVTDEQGSTAQAAPETTAPSTPAPTPSPEAPSAPELATPAPDAQDTPPSAQSSSDEEAAVKAQIESFVNQNAQTAPTAPQPPQPETAPVADQTTAPPTTEASNDAMANAIKNLVSDTNATPDAPQPATPKTITPPVQQAPPTMPAPNVIAPQPAAAEAPANTTPAPAPIAPQPEEHEDDNVAIAHKKVIAPIERPDEPQPAGLDELLAKEGISSLDDIHPDTTPTNVPGVTGLPTTPHPPGHVISPNTADSGIDPNSIAL